MQRYLIVLGMLVAVSGCAGLVDPYQREGTWSATHVNDDNLRAMVANPVDLQQGTGAKDTPGIEAAVPVTRLREDKVKTLPQSNLVTSVGSAGSGGQGSGSGGASQ